MMGACRENYIKDKLFPLLRNEIAAPPLGHRLIILPEYANSNPSNVIEYACKKAKVQRRNEWILTDAGGNMVSGGEFTPIRLGSTRFSSFGVLKCDEAIVYAFLNLSEQLNHIIFHPSDRCIVHVNREENIVVVECTRWKDFKIVKTIPLPQSLRLQPLDTDEQQHLYFRCQSTSSCSDAILMVSFSFFH